MKWRGRRKYLIEPRIQITLAGYMIGLAVLSLGGVYLGTVTTLHRTFQIAQQESLTCSPLLGYLEEDLKSLLNSIFLFDGIAMIVVSFVGGILIAHRVVGPIYKLRQTLTKLAQKQDVKAVSFRKHDFYRDLVPLLDAIIEEKKSPAASSTKSES